MTSLFRLLKALFYTVALLLVTLIFLVASIFPKSVSAQFLPGLYRFWSLIFLRIFSLKEHVHKLFTKPFPKQYILISNHPSGIELLWLPSRFKIIPLAKAEIRDWFVIGRIVNALGTIFVKRQDRESRHAASEALTEAARNGKNIMIFPEGGCYGKRLQPFFSGAFHLSKQTGVPILPTFLHYEEEDSYYWGDYGLIRFLIRALILPKNRNAHLYIFDTVSPNDFRDEKAMHEYMEAFYHEQEKKFAQ